MFTKYAAFEGAQVLDLKGSKERARTASLDKLSDFEDYRTADGYLYARIRAISSRFNKNWDGWPSVELAGGQDAFDRHIGHITGALTVEADANAKYGYSTFLGKPVFVDHNNSDPSRARGVVVDAKLHVEDHKTASELDPYYANADVDPEHLPPTWVELLLEVDAKSFPKLAQAIIDGSKDPRKGIDGFSMGCDVERSICNICKNSATTPDEYCQHIRMKGAHFDYKDPKTGRKTSRRSYENCYGIGFFELSAVFDPADETALTREIRASVQKEGDGYPVEGTPWCSTCGGTAHDYSAVARQMNGGKPPPCPDCEGTGVEQMTKGLPTTEHPLGPHTGDVDDIYGDPNRPQDPAAITGPQSGIVACPYCNGIPGDIECPTCHGQGGMRPPNPGKDTMGIPQGIEPTDVDPEHQRVFDSLQTQLPAGVRRQGSVVQTGNGQMIHESAKQAAMGTKDFRMLADMIATAPIQEQAALAEHAANYLKQTNPRFDAERFMQAAMGNAGGRDQFGGGRDYAGPEQPEEPTIPGLNALTPQAKTAQNPEPQSTLLALPEEVDTLRSEEVCPVCGSTMDEETCDVCGYVEPPDGFGNPDLTQAQDDREGDPESPGPEPEQQQGPQFQDAGEPAAGGATSNPMMTAHVTSDMSWDVKPPSRVAASADQEVPIVPNQGPATDEPNEEVIEDPQTPVTSSVRTAQDFIAAAGANPRRQMSTHTADAASGAPAVAKPDVNVDVEAIGGVDEASNEQASKADAQVDTEGIGGTGVEGVAADSTVSVDQGDEHSKNVEAIPTKTFGDGGSAVETQHDPVGSEPFPASADGVHSSGWRVEALESDPFPRPEDAPYGEGGAAVQGVQPADPVGRPDERVNVLDPTTSPENNSGPTSQWTGTDGNGVLRQQDPTTNESLEGEDGVRKSTHMLTAFRLADLEIKLGMLQEGHKYHRIAELEGKPFGEVAASLNYAQKVRTAAQNGRIASQAKVSRRLPVMGRQASEEKPESSDEDTSAPGFAEAIFSQ